MPRHYSTATAPVQWAQRPNFPVFSAGFLPIIPMRKFFSACCPKKGNPPAIFRKIPGTGRGSPPDGKKRLPDATASGSPGGGWWIRTTEGVASRFTVCPLWPLGKSPMYEIGAGGRIRTPDLLITNQLLYQLSYTSEFSFHSCIHSLISSAYIIYHILHHLSTLFSNFFNFFEAFSFFEDVLE